MDLKVFPREHETDRKRSHVALPEFLHTYGLECTARDVGPRLDHVHIDVVPTCDIGLCIFPPDPVFVATEHLQISEEYGITLSNLEWIISLGHNLVSQARRRESGGGRVESELSEVIETRE